MSEVLNISEEFRVNGCASIDSFLDRELCLGIAKDVIDLVNPLDLEETKEYENFIVINTLKTPGQNPNNFEKPVINIRGSGGHDFRFVDIFKADDIFRSIPKQEIETYINKFLSSLGHRGAKIEYSVYYTTDVKVRGYHRDNALEGNKVLYKLFVYLTDVSDIDCGPTAFIEKTHNKEFCKQLASEINGAISESGYDVNMNQRIFLGDAGMGILTTQNGIHRGFPQRGGKTRIMLVCKMRPY